MVSPCRRPRPLRDCGHVLADGNGRAYPDATVYAPPGLREKRKDIRFDADFSDGPIAAWAGEIDHAIMWGNRITTEVVFFHRQSGTAIR